MRSGAPAHPPMPARLADGARKKRATFMSYPPRVPAAAAVGGPGGAKSARRLTVACGVVLRSWSHVEQAPPDPILGVAEAFKKDPVRPANPAPQRLRNALRSRCPCKLCLRDGNNLRRPAPFSLWRASC